MRDRSGLSQVLFPWKRRVARGRTLRREKPRTPGSIPVGLRARAHGRRVQVADPIARDPLHSLGHRNASCFVNTYYKGDDRFASAAVGDVPGTGSRMGSPCPNSKAFATWCELPTSLGSSQPTPFSDRVSLRRSPVISEDLRISFMEWARQDKEGTSCMSIAVQYTLYYHARHKKYKLMFHRLAMDRLDEATRWLVVARALHAGALEHHTQGPLFSSTEKAVSYLCGFWDKGCGSARDKECAAAAAAGRDYFYHQESVRGTIG
ncbi:hypothetical protein Q5P01_016576 [Channa striata]|uniref:Uncharacterized protein n=1 Tax=Channa striata TaxID=64152 RepID=A0AA88SGC2_CHASR|nr:hypothetical protein Q5P01_016576 [Channa striata]